MGFSIRVGDKFYHPSEVEISPNGVATVKGVAKPDKAETPETAKAEEVKEKSKAKGKKK